MLRLSVSPYFTAQIHRHGDRTPIETYPRDPYRNISYWPDGWGQLTIVMCRKRFLSYITNVSLSFFLEEGQEANVRTGPVSGQKVQRFSWTVAPRSTHQKFRFRSMSWEHCFGAIWSLSSTSKVIANKNLNNKIQSPMIVFFQFVNLILFICLCRWKWNTNLGQNWQPFPIQTVPHDTDGVCIE